MDNLQGFAGLVSLMDRLRGPDGCPWDREQTLADIRAYLLEEAHEVAAAIDAGDLDDLAGELGDLLFHVVFISRLAEEKSAFNLSHVIERIHAKMVDRHPHVFDPGAGQGEGEDDATDTRLTNAAAVRASWERRKLKDTEKGGRRSLLDGVAPSLPALVATYRMTQKAAGVGFDWEAAANVLDKVDEEIGEVREELRKVADGLGRDGLREEIGDVLFTVANLARKLDIDPEAALAGANAKFRRRFQSIEAAVAERGGSLADAPLEELERLWEAAKREPG